MLNALFVVPFLLTIVFGGIGFFLAPQLSRRGIFFGVTVETRFLGSEEAQRLLSWYRRAIVAVTVAAIGILVPVALKIRMPLGMISVLLASLLHMALCVGIWARANQRVRPMARGPRQPRTVSLEVRRPSLPGGTLFFSGPLTVLCIAAGITYFRTGGGRMEVPAAAIAVPFLIGMFIAAVFMFVGYGVIFWTREVSGDAGAFRPERSYKTFSFVVMLGAAYFFSLEFASMILSPIAPHVRFGQWILLVLAFMLGACKLAYTFYFGQGGSRLASSPSEDRTPDPCWKWGLIYYNACDPAFILENRLGAGWTLNFGNPRVWIFVAVLFLPSLIGAYINFMK